MSVDDGAPVMFAYHVAQRRLDVVAAGVVSIDQKARALDAEVLRLARLRGAGATVATKLQADPVRITQRKPRSGRNTSAGGHCSDKSAAYGLRPCGMTEPGTTNMECALFLHTSNSFLISCSLA
jgi:hypothetical protein